MRRVIGLCAAAIVLSGCGLKANTFNENGRGYAYKGDPYSGPVCQLDTPVAGDVEYDVVGLIRGNRGWFGGFGPVRQVMADEARSAGADVISSMRMRQDVAFRGIFILRPIGEGNGLRLKNPETFDCLARGGRIYPANGSAPIYPAARTVIASKQADAGSYDECMQRVLKITDPALKVEAMSACDDLVD